MKPPEILSLLEEAAGTKLYEKKKDQSLKVLEKKQAKLEQIDAVSGCCGNCAGCQDKMDLQERDTASVPAQAHSARAAHATSTGTRRVQACATQCWNVESQSSDVAARCRDRAGDGAGPEASAAEAGNADGAAPGVLNHHSKRGEAEALPYGLRLLGVQQVSAYTIMPDLVVYSMQHWPTSWRSCKSPAAALQMRHLYSRGCATDKPSNHCACPGKMLPPTCCHAHTCALPTNSYVETSQSSIEKHQTEIAALEQKKAEHEAAVQDAAGDIKALQTEKELQASGQLKELQDAADALSKK